MEATASRPLPSDGPGPLPRDLAILRSDDELIPAVYLAW